MRKLAAVFAGLVAVYVLLLAGLAFAMHQPPGVFGRVMSHVPDVAFYVLPFQTLWMEARAGHLRAGDPAPDFALTTLDRSRRVRLSELSGRPVVLVFGSYT
ncbi:MAG TPA: hypothetical protein VN893_04245 [Bryobacteraceae bacterium]|nr:hypothetical protein [Bryobacteraceae bacterium]